MDVKLLGTTRPTRWRSWNVTLQWAVVAGRVECVGVEVAPAAKPGRSPDTVQGKVEPVTVAGVLRELPLGRMIEQKRREAWKALQDWVEASGQPSPPLGGPLEEVPFFTPQRVAARRKRINRILVRDELRAFEAAEKKSGGRPRYSTDHLQRVADVYSEAYAGREENPTATVAAWGHVSRSAAAKWVARAREKGLLPKTTRGRARGAPLRKGGR